MAIETVSDCINKLNNQSFYSQNVANSLFKNFNLALCYMSIVKYENTFYLSQGSYTKNCRNDILDSLKGKINNLSLNINKKDIINCWDINPYKSTKYIIVFGGIGSEKSNLFLQNAYQKFIQNGWGVFAFDYRGRGKSSGKFSQKNALVDANKVWNYLLSKGVNAYEIGILGHSMGAGVALDFASRTNTTFVILINPFNKAVDMAKNISQKLDLPLFIKKTVKELPDFLIPLQNRFNNEKALNKVQSPTLIVHNKDDKTIPVSLCRKLYKRNIDKKNITYIELEGWNHEIDDKKLDVAINFIKNSNLWFFNR